MRQYRSSRRVRQAKKTAGSAESTGDRCTKGRADSPRKALEPGHFAFFGGAAEVGSEEFAGEGRAGLAAGFPLVQQGEVASLETFHVWAFRSAKTWDSDSTSARTGVSMPTDALAAMILAWSFASSLRSRFRSPRSGQQGVEVGRVVGAAQTDDAAVALDDPLRVPGHIEGENRLGLLEVLALGEDVGAEQTRRPRRRRVETRDCP